MKEHKSIVLVPDTYIRKSEIFLCTIVGKKCLYLFIKTREHQPDICLHCLQDMQMLEKFDTIKLWEKEQ